MAMRLWNFIDGRIDNVSTITDANAKLYIPQGPMENNHYEILTEQGLTPADALIEIYKKHQVFA